MLLEVTGGVVLVEPTGCSRDIHAELEALGAVVGGGAVSQVEKNELVVQYTKAMSWVFCKSNRPVRIYTHSISREILWP